MGLTEKRILSGRYILVEQDDDGEPVDDSEVIIDVTGSFSHNLEADITLHAVEDGADITDNIKLQPYTISLSIIISDSKGIVDQIIDEKSVDDKRTLLIDWRNSKKLVSLLGAEDYINLYIKSLSEARETGLGNALSYTMTLHEIIIAEAAGTGNDKGKQSKGTDSVTDSQSSTLQGAS